MSDKVTINHWAVGNINFAHAYHRGSKTSTIVYLHGHGGSNEYLRRILDYPALSKYNVLIPDLVGSGDTKAPSGFSYKMRDHALVLRRLLEALSICGDIVLVGHSMGGAIAILLGGLIRTKLKGIVLAEGVVVNDQMFKQSVEELKSQSLEVYMAKGYKLKLEEMGRNPEYAWAVPYQAKMGAVSDYMSKVGYVESANNDLLLKRLSALNVPTLAVFGDKNRGRYDSEKMLSELKQTQIAFIPKAGHIMMRDNPDAFYSTVSGFIEKLKLG